MRKILYILGHFTDSDIEWILDVGELIEYKPKEPVIEIGEKIFGIYILIDGTSDVEVPNVGAVATLHPGEMVGEISFLEESLPEVTIRSVETSKVVSLSHEDICERFEEEPDFKSRFYHAISLFLCSRLRERSMQLANGTDSTKKVEVFNKIDDRTMKTLQLASANFKRIQNHFLNS